MTTIDPSFVAKMDRQLIGEGVPLHARPFHVVSAWMDANRIGGDFLNPRLWDPLMVEYRRLYPSGDFSSPGMMTGAVKLRDQIYFAHVNVGFGTFSVNPIDCIEVSKEELEIVWKQSPRDIFQAIYTVCDLWDFSYGIDDLQGQNKQADALWRNARSAISATARTLHGRLDTDSAVQSACLAAELAMKGLLAFSGQNEKKIRSFSHDLSLLAGEVASLYPRSSDIDGLLADACSLFPAYVETRYGDHGLKRNELQRLAIRAQFVVAESIRRISSRDMAGNIADQPRTPSRRMSEAF